jgi:hypothetical protein
MQAARARRLIHGSPAGDGAYVRVAESLAGVRVGSDACHGGLGEQPDAFVLAPPPEPGLSAAHVEVVDGCGRCGGAGRA